MNAIGMVQASLVSATQETTVALANANFDFSLIRYEAPAEYRELGLALAKNKKSEAEDGQAHATASRLGSLFKSILPETPNLIRAYGTRASEVAQSPIVNPRGTDDHGPFKEYVGVDGTSIWAAATSSSAAIAAHLLACMIACCWKHDEATAIWIEIVTERKRQLEEKVTQDEHFDLRDAVTSKLELDKDQLANWDASARAWLAAANDAPVISSRQKAVRGLLKELNTSIDGRQDVYNSVMEAWKTSLETLEKVVCGASYSIHDGAVILALATWHLYPDIIVQGSTVREISQKDDLVNPGGVITIGLENTMSTNSSATPGVHWSLSLGHLRYYGATKMTTRSLTVLPSGNSRFTFEEFVLVFLGAVIGQWNQQEKVSLESALEFINLVVTKFEETLSSAPEIKSFNHVFTWSWISVIRSAIASCGPVPLMHQDARKLLLLGMRKFEFIMGRTENYFDCKIQSHFRLFGLDSLRFASALNDWKDQDEYINSSFKRFMEKKRRAAKQRNTNRKFFLRTSRSELPINTAVFYCRSNMEIPAHEANGNDVIRSIQPDGGYIIDILPGSIEIKGHGSEQHLLWFNPPRQIMIDLNSVSTVRAIGPKGEKRGFKFTAVAQTHNAIIFGSVKRSCIRRPERTGYDLTDDIFQSYEDIQQTLQKKPLKADGLFWLMCTSPLLVRLRLLAAAAHLYSEIPGATILPEVLESRIIWSFAQSFQWSHDRSKPPVLPNSQHFNYECNNTRGEGFRLLSFFETGHDLEDIWMRMRPSISDMHWSTILAISTGDTLYITSDILRDPSTRTGTDYSIRRVRGNVGKPGFTLIGWFSSQPMECRRADPTKWQVINHNTFDGKLEDCFRNTSLHLQLTGYARDISFGDHNRVANGAFVDAVVSAYDKGEWLSDFNILSVFLCPNISIVVPIDGCPGGAVGGTPEDELVTIENWEEFLSPHPSTPAVVKCHGNWQARLTAAAMCNTLDYRPILFGRHGCWRCALTLMACVNARSQTETSTSNDTEEDDSQDDDEPSVSISETSYGGPGFPPIIFIL
ncbi:hypothetical protein F4775DRAFT_591297 [Biscogniauxia sp. FL1348]|nr:hypothetical protein F4775DRAFT_591297 [Biscogniauxia sp. FL1348]